MVVFKSELTGPETLQGDAKNPAILQIPACHLWSLQPQIHRAHVLGAVFFCLCQQCPRRGPSTSPGPTRSVGVFVRQQHGQAAGEHVRKMGQL